MKTLRLLPLLSALATVALAGPLPFQDPFTADESVPERRAMRGDWQIADGVATVTQNDELYRKYKDHGPILFYDIPTENATFRYAFKSEGCKSVVFTINGDGHVFRFVTTDRGTGVRAFPSDPEVKSIAAAQRREWTLVDGQWTDVIVKVEGTKVTLTFGEHEPISVEHETYSREKTNFSIGHSFGSLSVREVAVE